MSELKHELHNLRDENRRLRNTLEMSRKQEDIYISTLVEIMNLSSLSPMINDVARKTLFGLNGKGCPVGAVGKNGLTKEEIEDVPATTDKLSVEKLQEQLNTMKKALAEIIFFSQGCYAPEYFASIAQKALAAIGGDDE